MAIPMIKTDSGIAPPTRWYSDSKRLVILSAKVPVLLSRGILQSRKGRCTIHFNEDFLNTRVLFQTVHCVNQLSVFGAVTNWCSQFGLTEKGRVAIPVTIFLTVVEPEEVELLVSPPTQAPGNRMQGGALTLQILDKKVQLTQLCGKNLLPTSCDCRALLQNSTKCRRRMANSYFFSVENIRVLDIIRKPKHCHLFPKAPSLDQFRKFTL